MALACKQRPALIPGTEVPGVSCGISPPFEGLSPTSGQVAHALLTRLPRYRGLPPFAFDLHVLSTPPAFVLSQDQTLQLKVGAGGKPPVRLYQRLVWLFGFGPARGGTEIEAILAMASARLARSI